MANNVQVNRTASVSTIQIGRYCKKFRLPGLRKLRHICNARTRGEKCGCLDSQPIQLNFEFLFQSKAFHRKYVAEQWWKTHNTHQWPASLCTHKHTYHTYHTHMYTPSFTFLHVHKCTKTLTAHTYTHFKKLGE